MRIRDLDFQDMGGQPAFAPDDLERFLAEPRIALLAWSRRDGSPAQAPIWYRYRDGEITMSSTSSAPKVAALRRNPRASFTVQDERPPYRAVILDGTVDLSEIRPDAEHDLAVRYFGRLGAAEYERMTAGTYREKGLTRMTFRAERARGFDNTRLLSAPMLGWIRLRDVLPIPRTWV